MKNIFLFLPFLALLCLQISCQPEEPIIEPEPERDCFHPYEDVTLPEADGDGYGGMGCYVNGNTWKNAYHPEIGGAAPSLIFNYYQADDYVAINAARRWDSSCIGPTSTEIHLSFEPVELGLNNIAYRSRIFVDKRKAISYSLDTLSSYNVYVTHLDKEEGIMTGTFEFTAISNEGIPDTVVITDGRFDVRF